MCHLQVYLLLTDAPVIACSDFEWKARVGDQVRIGCNVKAYPSSRIKWDFASDFDEELGEQENIIFSRTVSAL